MAENSFDAKPVMAKLKPGILPDVHVIKRTDFSRRAEDIEKAEEARRQALALEAGAEEGSDALDYAREAEAVAASLAAQEGASDEDQLDESSITDEPKWYVAHTYSGYENKVKINIEKTIENRHLENQIFEVRVPMHDTTEVKDGKRKNVSRKMFPGYVLVRMIMNDDTWYVVRNTRGVTGFVGPGSKPVPLTEAEMKSLGIQVKSIFVDFEVGDSVSVVAGIWKDTIGIVQKMDYNKQSATINVELFGRETPVEIGFAEIRKYS
jgi:transcriptional antiterminator NusG